MLSNRCGAFCFKKVLSPPPWGDGAALTDLVALESHLHLLCTSDTKAERAQLAPPAAARS